MKFKGFTLIELLIVVTIMAVLVVVLLPQLNSFNRSQALGAAAAAMQTHFRVSQSNALNGVECKPGVPAVDWRLLLTNSSSYRIEPSCTGPTPTSYFIPEGIKIYSVQLDTCSEILATGDGSNLKDFGIIYNNISGGATFKSSDVGCPVSSTTSQLTIKLILENDASKFLKVVAGKGGSIYLNSN